MATSSKKEIGDYLIDADIDKIIGEGMYGQVFLGEHVRIPRKIAAKMFRWEKDLASEEMDREANIMMKIPDHENVMKILDYIKKEVMERKVYIQLWLIMEYCPLGNLSDYARKTSLSFMEKTELMLQSARGLQHLHEQKLIHRDVKPQNILVTGSSDNPTVKLADFGQSKFIPERMILATHSLQGTKLYMAPEMFSQVVDSKKPRYNDRVDVFSLGVTDQALLTAVEGKTIKPMTEGDEELGRFLYRQSGPTAQVRIAAPEDTKHERQLKHLLTKMLAKDPDDRPSSEQVVESLTHLITTVKADQLGPKPQFLGESVVEEKNDKATATALSAPNSNGRKSAGNVFSRFTKILPQCLRPQVGDDEATVQSAQMMRDETSFDALRATKSHKNERHSLPCNEVSSRATRQPSMSYPLRYNDPRVPARSTQV